MRAASAATNRPTTSKRRREFPAQGVRRTERPPLRAGATPPHNDLQSYHVTLEVNGLKAVPLRCATLRSGDLPGPDVGGEEVVAHGAHRQSFFLESLR